MKMFFIIKLTIIVLCVLSVKIPTVRARGQSVHLRKALNGATLANSYVLGTKCSGTSRCTLLHCARLCGSDELCKSLSFGSSGRTCVHYGIQASDPAALRSVVSHSGWDTWEMYAPPLSPLPLGPCDEGGYVTLHESRRSAGLVTRDSNNIADDSLAEGWYRFKLNGSNAVIPTICIKKRYLCGAYYPMWLDLQGAPLPEAGAELTARACGGGDRTDCCKNPRPVTVRHCGSFLVYKLVSTENENNNYCAQ